MNRKQVLSLRTIASVAAVLSLALVAGLARAVADDPKPQTIRLVIDYNDGVEKHFTAIAWKPGLTVLDCLNAAKASPHGITFDYRGSGDAALLTQIDDLKNSAGRTGRSWLYWVNDQFADRSFAIRELKDGDKVVWKYDTYGQK